MSEVEISTTDIDNNVQETPKATPRKRLSRAEKARLESEELLKALGVTMESGRQTRSSRRGTTSIETTPKPEPTKRKQPSTPRSSKKAKVIDIDQIDSTNHVEEGNNTDTVAKIDEASAAASSVPAKIVQSDAEEKPIASESASNNGKSEEKMEIDNPIESTQSEVRTQPDENTQPEAIEDSPIAELSIEDEPPIEEDSLPVTVEDTASTAADVTEVIDDDGVSAAADTTATIVVDSEPITTSPPASDSNKDEPIELQSSPSDIDQNDDNAVTNSHVEPDTIVDLESSSNEDDAKNEAANNSQEVNSLDLEVINSDSSLGVSEIQDEQQTSSTDNIQEQPVPTSTSTAEVIIAEIKDPAPVAKTNEIADNLVQSSEPPQNLVESTNQKSSPDNFCKTITSVETPIEETITTTSSESHPLEPNATTA